MPKKRKSHAHSAAAKITSPLKTIYKKVGKSGSIFLALLIVAAMLLAMKQVAIYREKRMYDKAEAQISRFTDRVVKLDSSAKRVKDKYCTRLSEKFSEGEIVCIIKERVILPEASSNKYLAIEEEAQKYEIAGWRKEFSESARENASGTIRKTIYRFDDLTCGIYHRNTHENTGLKDKINDAEAYSIEASCTGPALREYY